MQQLTMHIDGKPAEAMDGRRFESIDPFLGTAWASLPRAASADVDLAVRAAHKQFVSGDWARITAAERGLLLHEVGKLIVAEAEHLAELEVRDNGKLMTEMLGQVRTMAGWFRYFGGLADKVEGAITPADRSGLFHSIRYEPLGVVAAIIPWNAPLLLTAFKLAPALAAGNTIVIKPSEHASASSLALSELFERAGIPPGVVNVVTGFAAEVGQPLVSHPLVSKVAFTGGQEGGQAVYQTAARSLKPVSLELGGKTPCIVFEDADLEEAVAGAIRGIFAGGGQTCMASSRLLLHSSIHDSFVDRLVALARGMKLGNPHLSETDMGPIATEAQFVKILRCIEDAKAEGAVCVAGGKSSEQPGTEAGWYVEPTIFTHVRNSMKIAREEIFGPVLAVIKFESEEEAIEIANDTPFGLAAAIWTRDLRRVMELPSRLRVGTVWVNTCRITSHMAPFGGFKQSGFGREGGQQSIREYLAAKSVFISS